MQPKRCFPDRENRCISSLRLSYRSCTVSIHSLPADFPRSTSAALLSYRLGRFLRNREKPPVQISLQNRRNSFFISFIYLFIYYYFFFCVFQADRGEYEANAKRVKRWGWGGGEGGAQKKCTASAEFWLRTEAAQCSRAVMSLLISLQLIGLVERNELQGTE